ncbi:MAG: hypothetical protein AAFP85_13150 [Pseudomonadota bacterium]
MAALCVSQSTMSQAEQIGRCAMNVRPAAPIPDVHETWSHVARNAFAADGTAAGYLQVTLLIAVTRGDAPPCLAPYLIEELTTAPDGSIAGLIVPTNMDYPSFVFEPITIDPAMVVDWRFAYALRAPHFGEYQRRHSLGDVSDQELIEMGLSPDPVPSTWQ